MSDRGETIWFDSALLATGWARQVRVSVRDGQIAAIETQAPRRPGESAYGPALPGLPNLHSHAFQRGMAGLAEVRGPSADSFWTWREVMYRFLERLGPDEVEAVAALAYAEMLESGFTRVGEFHYLHHDQGGRAYADPAEMAARIGAAAEATGLGLTLLPVFYAHSGFGGGAPTAAQARFINNIDIFARLLEASRRAVAHLPGAVVGLAPHSLRAATPAELEALVALAGDRPIHIHIAEQIKEVFDCEAWSGQRPVDWLLDHAPVDSRWCLVHATHVTPQETERMAASGAVVGLCPITEANLGDGLFPAKDYLNAGGRFGIGSDSNVLIDAAEELRLLEYGQRLARRTRNVMATQAGRSTGGDLYRAALAGGAQALGGDGLGISVGAPADFVSLDAHHPTLIGREGDAILDSFVFAARRDVIDGVWRAGRKVVSNGRHHRRDEITARYRQALEKVLA
ncbi:formimidoylglutamate deiminase [Phenylobacterium sp.]|uniref:formimidoylglutamate deiminase n=1 Tax=Phenylobacterium sp. TaxID=1871053 RepID=UPI002730C00A|nr:formimidoylglutamate deiminase [Phenylobacterium sp.]MDP1598863.1 formimidoylglutamate deiminase [Phenylobacterium sp.]MDP3594136.1 formimidoylglutamate deiminase [Phenylobacterium sp.]